MSDVFYHSISDQNPVKIYSIDSNVLINMSSYFYNGHCHDEIETKKIIEFILRVKNTNGLLEYDNAINETCFNYTTNMLEPKALNGYMHAIDSLIMYASPEEVTRIESNYKPDMRFNNACHIDSILNCNVVEYFLGANTAFPHSRAAFYLAYLYNLQILDFHRDSSLTGINKLKRFYSFMVNEIGCVSSLHLILAQMLFVGNSAALDTAQRILKPKSKYSFRDIINSTMDMVHIQTAFIKQSAFAQCHQPCDFVIVAQDIGMIELCRVIERTYLIFDGKSSMTGYEFQNNISEKYYTEWELFYNEISAELKDRSSDFMIHDMDKDKVMNSIIARIPHLEHRVVVN